MNWIKKFRELYGLSLYQLALFTGKTVKYISVVETRKQIPASVAHIVEELEELFQLAEGEIPESAITKEVIPTDELVQELLRRIEKKETQLSQFAGQLKKLKKRERDLLVLQLVSSKWKAKKLGSDPDILAKMGPIESGILVENLRCGPAAQSRIRLKMARVRAEIESAKEEIVKISPFTRL